VAPGFLAPLEISVWKKFIASKYSETALYLAALDGVDYFNWSGLVLAYCLTKAGIKPVFGDTDTSRFLYSIAWLEFGTKVESPRPGDILIFDFGGGDYHVALFEGLASTGD
jgi:hypothetical protein